MSKIPFAQLFPRANPDALDLLDRMLAFDPSQRISVEDALEHRYLAIWHDTSDEPACPTTFDFGFEVVEEVADMRRMILDEVARFRRAVRQPIQQQQQQQAQQQQAHQQYGQQAQQYAQQQGQVPIPDSWEARHVSEDPRPQEMAGVAQGGLEQDLAYGMDASRHAKYMVS